MLDNVSKKVGNNSVLCKHLWHLNKEAYFITEFHNDLRTRLNAAAKLYPSDMYDNDEPCSEPSETNENIGDIFVKMQHRFLAYGPFIVRCENFQNMVSLMEYDENVKKEVAQLERHMADEMEYTKNKCGPTSLYSLLTIPRQHVLR